MLIKSGLIQCFLFTHEFDMINMQLSLTHLINIPVIAPRPGEQIGERCLHGALPAVIQGGLDVAGGIAVRGLGGSLGLEIKVRSGCLKQSPLDL